MDKTLQQTWQPTTSEDSNQLFEAALSRIALIELGLIEYIEDGGRYARVRILGAETKSLRCEILSIGNLSASIQSAEPGQSVLVLYPRNQVNVGDMKIPFGGKLYNADYAKCIPIGANGKSVVSVGNGSDGFTISSDSYTAMFLKDRVQIVDDKLGVSLDMDANTVAVTCGGSMIHVTEDSIELCAGGTWLNGELQEGSGKKIKINGDLEVTGNLTAAGGNFEATL